MRLDKYLAETAQCTRSEAKTMLAKGCVHGQRRGLQERGYPAEGCRHRGGGRRAAGAISSSSTSCSTSPRAW
ncbi:MAG: hypothetical protein ACLVJH_09590 [Faecalibacterium prausnitzii]